MEVNKIMTMAKGTHKAKILADQDAMISRLASECIQKIDAAGDIGCDLDGVKRVAERIMQFVEEAQKKQKG